MKLIGRYDNFIFDLYGTLIDINTDENAISFWKKIADIYSCYGADYTPAGIREKYLELCAMEEKKLQKKNGSPYPEIKLEKVFKALYIKAENRHDTAFNPRLEELTVFVANAFRTLSEKYLKLYPGTMKVFDELKKAGKKIYLLSNAQAVFTVPEMERLGIYDKFDDVFISSDLGRKKPDPEFLNALIKKHKLDPKKSIMVGNEIEADMGIALACGMDGAYINVYHMTEREIDKRIKPLRAGKGKGCKIYKYLSGDIEDMV